MWLRLQRWRGVVLTAIVTVATIILAVTNQLQLYIHPRYIIFTVAMVVLALGLIIASTLSQTAGQDDPAEPTPTAKLRALSYTGVAVAAALAVSMLALPPATLTSATADQRDINSTALGSSTQDLDAAASAPIAAFASFTVLDWASLLRQTSDVGFYAGKPVTVQGFIVPDQEDPDNMFYVSRFFVTCCAVDAQPAGIPVYLPGWASSLATDDWVDVSGEISTNPSRTSTQPLAVIPDAVVPIEQPSDPYLF